MTMHRVIVVACDAEGCAAVYHGPNRFESRARAADEGWTTASVPEHRGLIDLPPTVLDYCPDHGR